MACPPITVIPNDLHVEGPVAPDQWLFPPGNITDRNVVPFAAIPASAVEHQHRAVYTQRDATAVVDATEVVWLFKRPGKVLQVDVTWTTKPSGADTVTIDVQRGNAGANFASILSSLVTIAAADTTVHGVKRATLTVDPTVCAAGDLLAVVINATGTSAQGIGVVIWLREQP